MLAESDDLQRRPPDEVAERIRRSDDPARCLLAAIDDAAKQIGGDPAAAAERIGRLAALADVLSIPAAQARARRAQARALSYLGRLADALALCRDAVTVAVAAGESVEAGRAQLASMHALGELGRLDEAIRTGQAARELFINADEPALAARADINLGIAHQRRDAPATAVECLARARPWVESDPLTLGHLDNSRGEALLALNDFAGAQAAFAAALAAFEAAGADLTAAIAEGNLADLAARQGRVQRSLFHFERARRRLEQCESPGHLARLISEQAEAKSTLVLPRDALREYELALPELDGRGLALEAARARTGMGLVLMRLGRLTEAQTALAAAATAFQELGHATAKARVDLARAELALRNGQRADARAMSRRALAALEARPVDSASARELLARTEMQAGDTAAAESELSAGLAIAERFDLAPLRADFLHLRGRIRRSAARHAEAAADCAAAIDQVERVRGSLQAERFRSSFLGHRSAVYEDLVDSLLMAGGDDAVPRAFAAAEQAKSRSLLDQVRSIMDDAEPERATEAPHGSDRLLLDAAAVLRAELNALYSRLTDQPASTGPGADLRAWQQALHDRESRLEDLESRLATTRGLGRLLAQPIGIAEARELAPDDGLLLEYFIAHGSLMVFVIGRDRELVVRGLAPVDEVIEGLRRVQFQIDRALRPGADRGPWAASMLEESQRELGRLHDLLLGPLRGHLADAAALTIVPHGPLHLVPFQALWDGARYLVETHRLSYSPSASLLHELQSPGGASRTGAASLVVGVADETAPQIDEEVRQVAGHLKGRVVRLVGPEATVAAVLAAASGATLIHLACHGRFSMESPSRSGLRLADRWMTVRDIYELKLDADLVSLSGCQTGVNLVTSGDELTGLLRPFFAAGARAMLISQWRVDDVSTMEFMAAFYRRWNHPGVSRLRPSELLRQAQLEVLRGRSHPAFWAPFMLVGRERS
jgi:tetratricopeptide (TPR) repeat protein